MSNINNFLTYEEVKASINGLEQRLVHDLDLWKMFRVENIEVPAGRVVITHGANTMAEEPAGLKYIRKCFGNFGDLKHYEDWQANILTIWTNEDRVLSRFKALADIEGDETFI